MQYSIFNYFNNSISKHQINGQVKTGALISGPYTPCVSMVVSYLRVLKKILNIV